MRWTWLPRYYPDLHASDNDPRRFWIVHTPMVLAIGGFFSLPPVHAWIGADPRIVFALILLHLGIYASDIYLGIYRRAPVAFTTLDVTVNLGIMAAVAALPGRMVPALWSFFGLYILYLARAFPLSAYTLAVVVSAPLMVGQVWTLSGATLLDADWSQLGFIAMVAGALYLTLTPSIEAQRRVQAELEAARERERIAASLHDTVGTTLAEVALWHDLASMEGNGSAKVAVERARHRTAEALLELRMAVTTMTAGEMGAVQFEALLRARIQSICQAGNARCQIEIEPSHAKLLGETAHHLSNLITEAVRNAVRHGRPSSVSVDLRYAPLRIEIRDDGRGFAPRSIRRGLGMASMRARAAALDAKLHIRSTPGAGTVVEVRGRRSVLTSSPLATRH